MMKDKRLTPVQKKCLAFSELAPVHIAEPGRVNRKKGFWGKETVRKLILCGHLSATEYFNKYSITEKGREKIAAFRKEWKEGANDNEKTD